MSNQEKDEYRRRRTIAAFISCRFYSNLSVDVNRFLNDFPPSSGIDSGLDMNSQTSWSLVEDPQGIH